MYLYVLYGCVAFKFNNNLVLLMIGLVTLWDTAPRCLTILIFLNRWN